MSTTQLRYYCRVGYLYVIDNMEKYKDGNGDIDYLRAVDDCISDPNIRKYVANFIDLIWEVHGTDNGYIRKIRKAVKRSRYAKAA